jgi:hypothetical protein
MIPVHRDGPGHYTMQHPLLGELHLARTDTGWIAETTGLDGKRVAERGTLHELRKYLEKQ